MYLFDISLLWRWNHSITTIFRIAEKQPKGNKLWTRNRGFNQLNFVNTPTIAALAVLSQLKKEVARVETKALDQLASLGGTEVSG